MKQKKLVRLFTNILGVIMDTQTNHDDNQALRNQLLEHIFKKNYVTDVSARAPQKIYRNIHSFHDFGVLSVFGTGKNKKKSDLKVRMLIEI